MIGSGYVGLVTGACFSDLGNEVICVDNDTKKIDNLKKGIIPIYEPGLEELVIKNTKQNRLTFSSNLKESVKKSDIIFICVGTPTRKNGSSADLSYVYNVVKEISLSINKFKIIITKSTVPVTTGDLIENLISKKVNKNLFCVASNPEFLREGEAIRDFTYPDRIVIGTDDKRTNKVLKELYSPLISKGAQYIQTARRSAELIKYASNAFLATKITFINEIANLCEKINVNVEDVAIAMGLDKRIGSRFLRAGPAYGGSCFPKDTKAIVATANEYKTNLSIIKSVIKSNENRNKFLINRVNLILKNKIKNKKITFLGVTFKANTDDMRDSSCLTMIPELVKKGASIKYYDPTGYKEIFKKFKNVSYEKTIERSIDNVDLIIIHTEWNDFKSINFNKLINKKKTKIFDMRNIYSSIKMKNDRISYFSIGK
jgi:UDPglucose 6-dehydrogenase